MFDLASARRLFMSVASGIAAFSLAVGIASDTADAQKRGCRVGTKIVGGEEARISNWPGQAAIRLHSDQASDSLYFCGGTAISKRWVLTAAHCMHDYASSLRGVRKDQNGIPHPAKLQVVLQTQDLSQSKQNDTFDVERVVIHPVYQTALEHARKIQNADDRANAMGSIALDLGNDLALLRLSRDYDGPKAVVALSDGPGKITPAGSRVRVAGFGKTVGASGAPDVRRYSRADKAGTFVAGSRVLLETSVETISTGACQSHHERAAINDSQICAGHREGGQDSCSGDSGGPLVAYDDAGCPFQVGVVSWGDPVCGGSPSSRAAYGVYVRTASYADWIQKHTGPLTDGRPLTGGPNSAKLSGTEVKEGLAQLQDLLGPARGRIKLHIDDNNRIRLGEKLVFKVNSSIPGRLALIDINAKGEVLLIFPNGFLKSDAIGIIKANQEIKVPDRGYGFTAFKAVEPVGRSRMIALVAPENFQINAIIAPEAMQFKGFEAVNEPTSYFMRFIRQISRFLTVARSGGQDGLDNWAFTVVDYEIVP
ncbi:MAG: trypsin-like serine protease [Hyphomicrobiaceae bacterium]